MIVYSATKEKFNNDVKTNQISGIILDSLRSKHISGGQDAEFNSWQNSLHFMKDVIDDPGIPNDVSVAIEYQIPRTSKRVDFMIAGADDANRNNVVVVELKQWTRVEKVDDIMMHSVKTFSPDYCVMYLGGFANRHQIDLIKKIHHYNPLAHFSHFGDIDIGGFFIHQHLCRNTNISFDLFHMNIDDLHNSEYKTCLQSLTDNDRERAKSLLDSELYKRTISVMLDENIKLEQEIICLKLQRQFKTIK